MKKSKKTNFLKLGIFLFGISLSLWNCEPHENDLTPKDIKSTEQLNNSIVENISFDELPESFIQKYNEYPKNNENSFLYKKGVNQAKSENFRNKITKVTSSTGVVTYNVIPLINNNSDFKRKSSGCDNSPIEPNLEVISLNIGADGRQSDLYVTQFYLSNGNSLPTNNGIPNSRFNFYTNVINMGLGSSMGGSSSNGGSTTKCTKKKTKGGGLRINFESIWDAIKRIFKTRAKAMPGGCLTSDASIENHGRMATFDDESLFDIEIPLDESDFTGRYVDYNTPEAFDCACDNDEPIGIAQFLELEFEQASFLFETEQKKLREKICAFVKENNHSDEVKIFGNELIKIIHLETNIDFNTLDFVLKAFNQNKIYNLLDSSFLSSVNQFMDLGVANANPDLVFQLQTYFTTKCAVLRFNHPDWSDAKIYWEASKDFVHIALDGFGMIPVVGEIADLTNGVLYLIEGDGVNATLSFAATAPLVGWGATTGKYAVKIIKASTLGTKVRLTWKILPDGSVYFGSQGSKLRKVLGITDATLQAHHIMPWTDIIKNHDIIQKAAKSGSAFHINEALNGIAVAAWRNQPNHPVYTNLIKSKLDEFNTIINPNATVDEAYSFVNSLINDIRDWVINNPNSHLNDLILP